VLLYGYQQLNGDSSSRFLGIRNDKGLAGGVKGKKRRFALKKCGDEDGIACESPLLSQPD
jgi:hypothetical protein